MKQPLVYLTAVKLKNQIKSLVKSPAKLIYVILLVVMVLAYIVGSKYDSNQETFRDIHELYAIVTGFFLIMFCYLVMSGLSRGASMFAMSDVNLVFPAPISPQRVLFYGLFRQMGLSLLLGVFLLFQYGWLHDLYGISYLAILAILLGYAIVLFFAQICAMVLYSFGSRSDGARRRIRAVLFVCMAALVAGAAYYVLPAAVQDRAQAIPRLVAFMNLPWVLAIPVGGWAGGLFCGLMTGNLLFLVAFPLCLAALLGLLLFLITKTNQDYYEDVIQSAERDQSAISAKKEGAENTPRHVRVGKVGIGRGSGASVFFYKHMLENRRAGVFLLSNMSLLFAAISILFAYIMRKSGIVAGFAFATYMQFFSTMLGRFSRELSKPYIYLAPEPPLKKLLWSLGESFAGAAVEAVLLFLIIGGIVGAAPAEIVACMLARVGFACLFIGANVLSQRVFGGVSSRAFLMLFYVLVLLLMAIPGAALAIVFAGIFSSQNLLLVPILLGLTVGNVASSVLVLFLCRNMLQYAELNNR